MPGAITLREDFSAGDLRALEHIRFRRNILH